MKMHICGVKRGLLVNLEVQDCQIAHKPDLLQGGAKGHICLPDIHLVVEGYSVSEKGEIGRDVNDRCDLLAPVAFAGP
jgi:hypothetical protein